ncbi:MAG: efflux RND transporter permease subunit [Gammaproteobacteria bacterium]|nr:efflux RND transporter permease subunit [Gammaproteobacteria bacterium]
MKLIDVATDRRVTIAMATVAVVLFGLVALSRLNVTLLPDLSYPTLTVRTELTGAAPQEIETLLTRAIEEGVGVVRGVRKVRSVSRAGQSDVILEFSWGTQMDLAAVEVREKLDLLQLPLTATRPLLLRFDPGSEPVVRIALVERESRDATSPAAGAESRGAMARPRPAPLRFADDTDRLRQLRRLADEQLRTGLEAIEGVAAVKVSGGLEEEIQVLVDQQRLAQLGLGIEQVAARIRAENVNLSGGRLEQGSERFLVRTVNEFRSVQQMADSIVASQNGQSVFLRDIAEVKRGFREREAITRLDGAESIEIGLYREGDANTVRVAGNIADRLTLLQRSLPSNLELVVINDQSVFISAAIQQVRSAALLGGLLAILVLYGFLRNFRATVIVGLAIPVSVIGTFLLMFATDITLNIMSLGGIALAVGLLVDNAIVVLENVVRHREQGRDVLEAARRGTREVASAVTAATLTSIAVFFPMVFITGVAGQLFRDQALTVTFALLFSLLVALTLIPMLASLRANSRHSEEPDTGTPNRVTRALAGLLRQCRRAGAGVAWLTGRVAHVLLVWPCQGLLAGVARVYAPLLDWSLRHRAAVLLLAGGCFAATMLLVPRLGTELIPQFSQGEFAVEIRLQPGSPLARTDEALAALQQIAARQPEIALTYSVAGTGNRLDASPVDAGEHTGTLNVRLTGTAAARERAVINRMRSELDAIPGIQYEFRQPELLSFATPLEVEISGFDLEQINGVAEQVRSLLARQDRFSDVRTTVEGGNPEIQIIFDHERAARLGLMVRDIADRVVSSVRGDVATRYTWRDREIDVLVRSIDSRQASLAELRGLIVNPGSARPVPLEAVADIRVATGPAEIRRVDQSRVALVSASLTEGDLGSAVEALRGELAGLVLPAGVGLQVAGQSEEMTEALRSMQFTLLMAVFLVYLVMASQFESLVHPFVILFTIPLALVGAVLALYLTGTTLNVVAFIGIIMLAGIVVNNAIVLVDFINQLREQGLEKIEAIRQAGSVRLRPILMTTLTTVLGLMPMAVGLGEGAEIRAPMAIAVIGGLLVSTLLTLVVIPVVYSLLDVRPRRATGPAPVAEPGT